MFARLGTMQVFNSPEVLAFLMRDIPRDGHATAQTKGLITSSVSSLTNKIGGTIIFTRIFHTFFFNQQATVVVVITSIQLRFWRHSQEDCGGNPRSGIKKVVSKSKEVKMAICKIKIARVR